MSITNVDLVVPLQLTPAQKSALLCLAAHSSDEGVCWPSIPRICEWTCLRRTAALEAVQALESLGLVEIDRTGGRGNKYRLQLVELKRRSAQAEAANKQRRDSMQDQSAKRTGRHAEPVRQTDCTSPANGPVLQTDHTSPLDGPQQSAKRTAPVRQTDPESSMNRQEPSKKKRARKQTLALDLSRLLPEVTPQVLTDWQQVRKAKRAGPITATVVKALRKEAGKAGLSLQEAVETCCARGWQAFNAEWVKPQQSYRERDSLAKAERVRERTGGLLGGMTDYRKGLPT